MAASVHSAIPPHSFLSKPKPLPKPQILPLAKFSREKIVFSRNKRKIIAVAKEIEVISVQSDDVAEQKEGVSEDRTINATIVLAAGSFAITKLLTIDHDYWHGWTIFEILRYAPQHNWSAYEEALKTNPVFAKMVISGVVYSLGDWIAQCFEGKPIFEFDRARMFRSGLTGFALHGSLSHYYYQFCEELFPYQGWWVVPAKVAFDQTAWSAVWNSIYYTVVGLLRLDSPINIFNELKATFVPMLTAGWKLWPFAHLITYGVIPVEQRLLWVDCVELIWVTILSTYSNEKSEARSSETEVTAEVKSTTPEVHDKSKKRYMTRSSGGRWLCTIILFRLCRFHSALDLNLDIDL
ncbi:hypothetical protein RIF29_19791 [Crotalaria pallida]|uniref:Uncharacterized protein n=1 Tax=Crotalaria pallida TaxID=3830 RepID=A0AAN9I5T0_CROPI